MTEEITNTGEWIPLLEEHRLLMKQIAEFRSWSQEVEQLGIPHFQEMGNRLMRLRDILSCHFIDEEAGGYLAPVLEVAPRFSREAENLQTQHPELLASIDGLIERLSHSPPEFESWQAATNAFEEFLGRLRQHESRENSIAQSAFGRDTGGGE